MNKEYSPISQIDKAIRKKMYCSLICHLIYVRTLNWCEIIAVSEKLTSWIKKGEKVHFKTIGAILCLTGFASICALAQTSSGSISGRALDPSQSAIANASVTATDQAKG